jgi:hypothetical protein
VSKSILLTLKSDLQAGMGPPLASFPVLQVATKELNV